MFTNRTIYTDFPSKIASGEITKMDMIYPHQMNGYAGLYSSTRLVHGWPAGQMVAAARVYPKVMSNARDKSVLCPCGDR